MERESLHAEIAALNQRMANIELLLQQSLTNQENWLSVKDAAQVMGVSETTMRRYAREGVVIAKRPSGKATGDHRILKSSLITTQKKKRPGRKPGRVTLI